MSGGSYDYLCYALDRGDLAGRKGTIEEMAARLESLGHREAARATRNVLYLLNGAEEAARALTDTWRAVEWLDSGDSGEDSVREAVAKLKPWPPAPKEGPPDGQDA